MKIPHILRSTLASLLAALALGGALAQTHAPKATVDKDVKAEHEQSVKAERDRITAERASIQRKYDADRAACYKQFAVSGCIEDLQVKRREGLADLRRQEILLNDEERRRKAGERIKSIEEKQGVEPREERPQKSARQPATPNARGERKLPQRSGPTPEQARANEEALRQKQQRHAENMAKRAERAAAQASNESEFAKKQQDAAEHRERTLKRDAERAATAKGSKAKPLPDPPT